MYEADGSDLGSDPRALRVTKRPVSVEVEFAARPGSIETREGWVNFDAGDALLTGVEGERWPIPRQLFEKSYEPLPGDRHHPPRYRKRPIVVLARQMDRPFSVSVGWSPDRLCGEAGDWLVQYGENDFGIVSRAIFEKTYDVLD